MMVKNLASKWLLILVIKLLSLQHLLVNSCLTTINEANRVCMLVKLILMNQQETKAFCILFHEPNYLFITLVIAHPNIYDQTSNKWIKM